MNWNDIKNIIKKELKEATEGKYIVVGKKNGGKDIQYGAEYNSKEEAQKVADKKNNDPKYKDISFSAQKGSIKEATTVSAGDTKSAIMIKHIIKNALKPIIDFSL